MVLKPPCGARVAGTTSRRARSAFAVARPCSATPPCPPARRAPSRCRSQPVRRRGCSRSACRCLPALLVVTTIGPAEIRDGRTEAEADLRKARSSSRVSDGASPSRRSSRACSWPGTASDHRHRCVAGLAFHRGGSAPGLCCGRPWLQSVGQGLRGTRLSGGRARGDSDSPAAGS